MHTDFINYLATFSNYRAIQLPGGASIYLFGLEIPILISMLALPI